MIDFIRSFSLSRACLFCISEIDTNIILEIIPSMVIDISSSIKENPFFILYYRLFITEYIGVIIAMAKKPTAAPTKTISTGSMMVERSFVFCSTSFS